MVDEYSRVGTVIVVRNVRLRSVLYNTDSLIECDCHTLLVGARLAMIVEIVVEQGALLQALRKTNVVSMTKMFISRHKIIVANDLVRVTEVVFRRLAVFCRTKVVLRASRICTWRVAETSSSTGDKSKASDSDSHIAETHHRSEGNIRLQLMVGNAYEGRYFVNQEAQWSRMPFISTNVRRKVAEVRLPLEPELEKFFPVERNAEWCFDAGMLGSYCKIWHA